MAANALGLQGAAGPGAGASHRVSCASFFPMSSVGAAEPRTWPSLRLSTPMNGIASGPPIHRRLFSHDWLMRKNSAASLTESMRGVPVCCIFVAPPWAHAVHQEETIDSNRARLSSGIASNKLPIYLDVILFSLVVALGKGCGPSQRTQRMHGRAIRQHQATASVATPRIRTGADAFRRPSASAGYDALPSEAAGVRPEPWTPVTLSQSESEESLRTAGLRGCPAEPAQRTKPAAGP